MSTWDLRTEGSGMSIQGGGTVGKEHGYSVLHMQQEIQRLRAKIKILESRVYCTIEMRKHLEKLVLLGQRAKNSLEVLDTAVPYGRVR